MAKVLANFWHYSPTLVPTPHIDHITWLLLSSYFMGVKSDNWDKLRTLLEALIERLPSSQKSQDSTWSEQGDPLPWQGEITLHWCVLTDLDCFLRWLNRVMLKVLLNHCPSTIYRFSLICVKHKGDSYSEKFEILKRHAAKMLHFAHRFKDYFCFCSRTFPSHEGNFFRLQWEFQWENDQNQ